MIHHNDWFQYLADVFLKGTLINDCLGVLNSCHLEVLIKLLRLLYFSLVGEEAAHILFFILITIIN